MCWATGPARQVQDASPLKSMDNEIASETLDVLCNMSRRDTRGARVLAVAAAAHLCMEAARSLTLAITLRHGRQRHPGPIEAIYELISRV